MSRIFRFQSPTIIHLIRIILGLEVIAFGWFGYTIIRILVDLYGTAPRYTTTNFSLLLLYEWLPIVTPIFSSLVPAGFVAGILLFSRHSWRYLVVSACLGGMILTIPPYLQVLRLWQPMLETIYGLPVTEVRYQRNAGAFPDGSEHMIIQFIIPSALSPEIESIINERTAQHKGRVGYVYMIENQIPEGIVARLYRTGF